MEGAFRPESLLKRKPWSSEMGIPLMGQILSEDVYQPTWVSKERLVRTDDQFLSPIRAKLEQAEMIEASDVCETFYTGTEYEDWDFERDVSRFALPFPVFWIEMKKPSRVVTSSTGVQSTEGFADRTGFLFQRLPIQRGKEMLEQMRLPWSMELQGKAAVCYQGACAPSIIEKRKKYGGTAWQYFTAEERWYATLLRYYRQNEKIKEVLEHPPETGYACGIHLFLQIRNAAFGPMGTWILLIGPDGKPLFRSQVNPAFITETIVPDLETLTALDSMLLAALFAVERMLHEMAASLVERGMNSN